MGLPGGENVAVLDAIRNLGIEFVLVKNESSACFMAATEARLTGSLGVALTTLGPGAANAYAGLAHAYLDRAPILLITAASDPDDIGRHTHQVLDLAAVFQPITKYAEELRPGNAIRAIDQALTYAAAGRPGPVHLSVHNHTASEQIVAEHQPRETFPKLAASSSDLKRVQELLQDKQRPLILVGLGLEPEAPYQVRKAACRIFAGAPNRHAKEQGRAAG